MTNNEKIIIVINKLVEWFKKNNEALSLTTYEPSRKALEDQNESILYAIHVLTLNTEEATGETE